MTKYNFDNIESPEIYFDSEQICTDKKSINNFINNLSWFTSKVGVNKSNLNYLGVRRSFIAEEKVNIVLTIPNSNDIINDFLDVDKIILSNSKSNITWLNENTMRTWDILKYDTGDYFNFHTDGKSEINHVGTILLLPPKSIFNYSGGELVLLSDNK